MPACLCKKRPTCRKPVSRREMNALHASGSCTIIGAMIFGKCGRVKSGMDRRSCGSITGRRPTTCSAEDDAEFDGGVGGTIISDGEFSESEPPELELEFSDPELEVHNLRCSAIGKGAEGICRRRGAART